MVLGGVRLQYCTSEELSFIVRCAGVRQIMTSGLVTPTPPPPRVVLRRLCAQNVGRNYIPEPVVEYLVRTSIFFPIGRLDGQGILHGKGWQQQFIVPGNPW